MAKDISATVLNMDKVLAAFEARSLKGKKQLTVQVRYDAPYAVYVHEDLEMPHPNGGQAKFLEAPARRLKRKMNAIIRSSVINKNGLEEGMVRAGTLLLEESRKLVPVDTGFLHDSGKVVVDGTELNDLRPVEEGDAE